MTVVTEGTTETVDDYDVLDKRWRSGNNLDGQGLDIRRNLVHLMTGMLLEKNGDSLSGATLQIDRYSYVTAMTGQPIPDIQNVTLHEFTHHYELAPIPEQLDNEGHHAQDIPTIVPTDHEFCIMKLFGTARESKPWGWCKYHLYAVRDQAESFKKRE